MAHVNIGVLVSGRGSNLMAIHASCQEGRVDGKVAAVISDNPDAHALAWAKEQDVPAYYVVPGPKRARLSQEAEQEVVRILREHNVDLLCLAGFMRIVGSVILEAFAGRTMNIHPALLPSFPGLEAQHQAFDYGVKVSGCTVHFVDAGVDTGPIIGQRAVEVKEDDTGDTLAARILVQEHEIYSEAIQLFAEGRLRIEGRRVRVLPPGQPV